MKTLISTTIGLLLLLPFTTFAANFSDNLKYGSKGDSVTELQEFLTAQNDYTGPVTGNFYSLTLAAVKRWQTANDLPSTGYFGPMSRAVALNLLALNDTAENAETGRITPPVSTKPADVLNQKVDQLNQQISDQRNIIDQQNQKLGQIVTNTAPVVVVPPPPPVQPFTFALLEVVKDNGVLLRVESDKELDFKATEMPAGVTMVQRGEMTKDKTYFDEYITNPPFRTQFYADSYYYEGELTGVAATGTTMLPFTFHSIDGQTKKATRYVYW